MDKSKLELRVKILLTILVVLIGLKNYVYASSFNFNATASKTTVKPGEEVVVSIKILDIEDVNDLGINAIEAILEYDSNVFEAISSEDISGKNNWTLTYNAENKNFLAHNIVSGVKETQEIGQIKFKAKNNISSDILTNITFKNIESNDGTKIINETDKQVNFTIKVDEPINSVVEQQPKIETKTDVKANQSIPQTGESENIMIIIGIATVVGLVSYIKFKKLNIK